MFIYTIKDIFNIIWIAIVVLAAIISLGIAIVADIKDKKKKKDGGK